MSGQMELSRMAEREDESSTFHPSLNGGRIFKFVRRSDLDMWTRLELAVIMNKRNFLDWGVVTDLARAHDVSRQFLYDNHALFSRLIAGWSGDEANATLDDEFVHRLVLCARLHCGASIGGIVETLKELGCEPGSAGHVSEFLKEVGGACEIEIPKMGEPVAILLDETFSQNKPIFVVMEASSHYILLATPAPDRKASTWEAELRRLEELGVDIDYFVKDQGSGLKAAAASMGMPERADLFHLLKPFDPFLPGLERRAYGAIEREMERERVFNNRKTEGSLNKALEKYEEAVTAMETAIGNFDDYDYLHECLHKSFDSFTPEGEFRSKESVAGDVETALSLLEEQFGTNDKIRAAVKFLRNNLDDYWGYVEQLEDVVRKHAEAIPEHTLRFLCLGWQLARKSMAVKSPKLKRKLAGESAELVELALTGAGKELVDSAAKLKADLDANIRSSSPLEAINSVIRGFLNTYRGQVTPETLNMIAFHVNNKVASRGKYAGTSAFTRLTGEPRDKTPIQHLAELSSRAAGWVNNNARFAA